MNYLSHAVIRECQNPDCRFRFPDIYSTDIFIYCPVCNKKAIIVETIDLTVDHRTHSQFHRNYSIVGVLDNVRSVYNVGALFRTALGFGLEKIYLCGITPTPEHQGFNKTSIGPIDQMQWEKSMNCVDTIQYLHKSGFKILTIEYTENSIPLNSLSISDIPKNPLAIVVGNEIVGIDRKVLTTSDLILSIPIYGKNKSFNVATAFGIALHHILSLLSN